MAKWNSKRWSSWIEVVRRVASHKDELSLREEPEVKSALTSPALQKYCHLKYFEWPMFVSKAAQTLFGHQSYWLCETWSCEPLALSQEVRCHFACVKQTYWVLTGAESLSTVVAEPNWTQLFIIKGFGDTTICWTYIPAFDPSFYIHIQKAAPFWANYRARAVPSSGLAQAKVANAWKVGHPLDVEMFSKFFS